MACPTDLLHNSDRMVRNKDNLLYMPLDRLHHFSFNHGVKKFGATESSPDTFTFTADVPMVGVAGALGWRQAPSPTPAIPSREDPQYAEIMGQQAR